MQVDLIWGCQLSSTANNRRKTGPKSLARLNLGAMSRNTSSPKAGWQTTAAQFVVPTGRTYLELGTAWLPSAEARALGRRLGVRCPTNCNFKPLADFQGEAKIDRGSGGRGT